MSAPSKTSLRAKGPPNQLLSSTRSERDFYSETSTNTTESSLQTVFEDANFSTSSIHYEVTQGAVEVWANLPDEIRQDPSLASFRQEHERIHGGHLGVDDQDPLPNEDVSVGDENISNNAQHPVNNEFITISVMNEHGEKIKGHLPNGENTTTLSDLHHTGVSTNEPDEAEPKTTSQIILNSIKIALLVAVWILFTGILMSKDEKVLTHHQLAVPIRQNKSYILDEVPLESRLGVKVYGAFADENSNTTNFLFIQVQLLHTQFEDENDTSIAYIENDNNILKIPIIEDVADIDTALEVKKTHTFHLDQKMYEQIAKNDTILRLRIGSNLPVSFPINLTYDPSPIDKSLGVIYAAIVLLGLYIMIIWEVVHRTFAAMVASTTAIAILALMNERPSMPLLMSWIDVETLLLLFGMMILVAILSETGVFDYLAVYAFEITNGKIWPLINCLCLFTAVMSSFLDNVTTVLLMTPVTIRLCEVMQLNPVPILMSMIIFSNIGGAVTPVGDPPNVIVASNPYVIKSGINFMTFSLHMSMGIFLVMIQTYVQLRYKFRNINDLRFIEPQDIQELRHEIAVWQRAAASLSSYSKDEDLVRETLVKKVNRLQRQLKKKLSSGSVPESYKQTLEDLQRKYPIRNQTLLIKSAVTLVFVISFFFLHSVPDIQRLSLGWTALLGAVLLLILADRQDMESILARVEWSTLLFFAALFVLMESLSELGLIDWIGSQTEAVILTVNEESRLAVAVLIILWVSAIASAFVDNIPLTTMMIKVSISLAEKKALNLPLQPLIWALAFGACLGGNGTLIGASANVVCAGVAEQHGYRFTFIEYFKVGFPVMLGSIVVATGYLLVCHVCFTWH
ncbi:P protein isoform X2 [Sitodiplosis mosellana]|uniref:P protein isoform X2 n=1 Tax=Sitodiplosis mosellana TaxID=263140 RepID=UPI002444A445|nr:P protein isoform X2 [Sitodiplosis mosellana]XP_055303067.1 P protein isoform X2 [Sitodiplosis mosellana]XP_055303068.1 P protein isoform X2 [Sitodiplosis mosellana]XP_055303069.1 P protein isoform X2 [Sitodiplosis mosellana]